MRRSRTPRRLITRDRRGIALVLTLLLTFSMAALSMAAIYVASNAGLIGRMEERERDLRYSADAALQMGKSELNNDPTALPDTGYATLMYNMPMTSASGSAIENVYVNVYAGPTGSTTGQFGRFASIVSEAIGPRGAKFVRRLELEQETFAKYAYWTNRETLAGGGTIVFGGGDILYGPVFSNDVITVHSSGASFMENVQTAQFINGVGNGTFKKGYEEGATPITLPTVTALSKLSGYAALGNLQFNAPNFADVTGVLQRLEFVAVDLNLDGDSTDVDEGFVRVYRGNAGQEAWIRGDYNATTTSATNCGDFHRTIVGGVPRWTFFPGSVHGTNAATLWARNLWIAGGWTAAQANNHGALSIAQIMSQALVAGQPQNRCFLGGDPNLVAVERNANGGVAAGQIGGEATTFTANGARGQWVPWPGAVNPIVAARRPADAAYLFPLYRGYNPGWKGVIAVNGSAGISGVLRGRVTVYMTGNAAILDDQRYATDPASGACNDIMGLISANNITIADNALNTPQDANGTRNMDDTKDLYTMGVFMAKNESFGVQNYSTGPTNVNGCGTSLVGRGCLYLTGGLIQERRGPVGTTAGTGFIKRYSYDRCAVKIPPPYFPTTGRFIDNRYSEVDPQRFPVNLLFQWLTPGI